jgi:hypothetical protein
VDQAFYAGCANTQDRASFSRDDTHPAWRAAKGGHRNHQHVAWRLQRRGTDAGVLNASTQDLPTRVFRTSETVATTRP